MEEILAKSIGRLLIIAFVMIPIYYRGEGFVKYSLIFAVPPMFINFKGNGIIGLGISATIIFIYLQWLFYLFKSMKKWAEIAYKMNYVLALLNIVFGAVNLIYIWGLDFQGKVFQVALLKFILGIFLFSSLFEMNRNKRIRLVESCDSR